MMSTINGVSGEKASNCDILVTKRFGSVLTDDSYGYYSQIEELPYVGQQFDIAKEESVQSGAVFIPASMPTKFRFSDFDSTVAGQIAGVLEHFTFQGVEVWLWFAHEMNWYARKGRVCAGCCGY